MGALSRAAQAALDAIRGVSTYDIRSFAEPSLTDSSVESIRRLLGGQIQPLPQTRTRWYLSDLESAEHAADTGDLTRAAQLMRSARKDGVISGVLSTRTGGLMRLPKRFRGQPEIVAALEEGHVSVRSVFDEMFPPSELALLEADGLLLGVGVAELVPVVGRDYPRMVRLEPEFLKYRWSNGTWYYRSIAGLLPITPGDGRWILHLRGGHVAPWSTGLWRAVGRAYIRKEHASLHQDNWEGKLANPARVAVAPQGAAEEQKQRWFQAVMAWGVNTVFGLLPGYDVKLLESNGRGYESFLKTIARCDREAIIAIAGQVVTTDGGAGFQNSDIHKSVRADLIQESADAIAYTINTQGIPPYVIQRWGEEALEQSAQVGWDVSPPKDLASEAQSLTSVGSAIKVVDEALDRHPEVDLDVIPILQRFGLPVKGDIDGDGVPDVANDANVQAIAASAVDLAPRARVLANAIEISAEDGVERPGPRQAPTAFRIWPAGITKTDKGDLLFNRAAADRLMQAQAERGNLYSFDVDHMSLRADAPPEARKAVAWNRLEVREDANGDPELWAVDLEWTQAVKPGLECEPPEWRYFSPAFTVHEETREVLDYINTALTNNPATWRVTALATRVAASAQEGTEKTVMDRAEMKAALKKMAEGEDENCAKAAKAALAAFEDEEKGDDEKKKDEETTKTTNDGGEGGGDEKKKDEETTVAASSVAPTERELNLARRVTELEARETERDERDKREKLLATRPDFSKEVRATLDQAPLKVVQEACKNWPRSGKGGVRDAQGATTIQATRGETQSEEGGGDDEEKRRVDELMGMTAPQDHIRSSRRFVEFRALPAGAARQILASKQANN